MENLKRACQQAQAPNGIRYSRVPIIRATLKQLKDTFLKDCQARLGAIGIGRWKESGSTFYIDFENIYSEWVFIPLEDAREQERLLSMQASWACLNEFTEMKVDILGPITGRLGRYPNDPAVGFCSWKGIIGNSNMPMEGSEWHHFLENLPANYQKFQQPSGLAEDAENLDNLWQTDETRQLPLGHPKRVAMGRAYYDNIVQQYGENHPYVIRYVKAEYGPDLSGEAVFKNTFRMNFHTVDETHLIPGYPLLIGQDFGRNPWSLICQVNPWGQLVVHEEVSAYNVGLDKHLDEHLKPVLLNKYLGYKHALIGDPAGLSKDSHSEENSFELLKRHGFAAYPAPTNLIEPRIRSVEALLGKQINGQGGVIINKKGCPMLIQGMAGGYRFMKTKEGGLQLKPIPAKNDPHGYSHVCDDLQYVSLVVHGQIIPEVIAYLWPPRKGGGVKFTSAAWT